MNNFAPHQLDFYKTGHKDQYPKGTTFDEIRSLIYKDVFAEIRNEICDSDIL